MTATTLTDADGLTVERTAASTSTASPTVAADGARRGLLQRTFLGRPEDPRWARPALWGLLLVTAVVYFWNLTSSGYANEFYAAAVKSATQDWKAWLFGSLDSANAITVDKPPASLWVMGLSARIFGFSSFSLLMPQALMGVGTVALMYATVRRQAGHLWGLLAGLLVTLTPVAALMFRFDNPDALLVLLMTGAAYMVARATETERGRTALWWMVGAGAALGFAFLTKMLQGLLVLPALGLAYVIAARHSIKARIAASVAAIVSLVVSAGWLIALVSLWPSASRAYIGGSTNDSLWELALGYNGLGRILGNSSGNGGGGGGANFGGTAGILRMFNSAFGGEIAWLLPAALLLLVAGLAARGRAARTDAARSGLVMWGGWMLVTAIVLSFMEGTVHSYYAVALVPGIAGSIAIGAAQAWQRRDSLAWRVILSAAVAVTAMTALYLLKQASWFVLGGWVALGLTALGIMAFIALGADGFSAKAKRLGTIGLILAATSSLFGTTAYTVATISQGHSGSMPASGPSVAGGGMGGGQRMGTPPSGAPGSTSTSGSSTGTSGSASTGTSSSTSTSTSTTSITELLNSAGTTWSAATVGDQSAASYILSTNTAVMSLGGWSGTDDNVTLAQFQEYVANGQIHYFIAGGGMGGGQGNSSSSASQISTWVAANYTATTVGGVTVYDLTA